VLDRRSGERPRRLPSIARAAASPSAIVLAGAGVAAGELGHLGIAATAVLGAAGYGARLGWAALHRHLALRRRARERLERIDPWSLPEPWRGYVGRALDARRRLQQLAGDLPAGLAAAHLAEALSRVDAVVEEHWAIARSGAAIAGRPGQAEKVAADLAAVQARRAALSGAAGGPGTGGPGTGGPGTGGPGTGGPGAISGIDPSGSEREALLAQEESLASQLRAARRAEEAAARVAARLGELSAQLEGLVAAAAELVANAGPEGSRSEDLGTLSSRLTLLSESLEEARRIAAPGAPEP
jgi:hypothetical protein